MMKNKWIKIKLSRIADVIMGQSPESCYYNYDAKGMPFLQGNRTFGTTYPYFDTWTTKITKQAQAGDIIMSVRAPVGDINITPVDICLGRGVCSIRMKNNNQKFLYYLIKHSIAKLTNKENGTVFGSVNRNDIEKVELYIPDNDLQQQRIAYILSKYDDLIENNNKRIKLLEQMAENLYKEWFVRFRFPNYKKVSFKQSKIGKIPNIFNIVPMNEVIDDYITGGWGEENQNNIYSEEAFVIRGTDFPFVTKADISTCPKRFHKKSNYESRKLKENDIIIEISGGTEEQPVGRTIIISKEKLNRFDNKVICASFCKLIRLNKNKISAIFFYYWMHFLYKTRIIDIYQLQSTGIINFKFEYFLKKGILMLPSKNIMERFENIVSPIHKEIDCLGEQNQNLIKQRDLLLPRLMSGKLEI